MVKNTPASAGASLIPGSGRSLEKEMATHSGILAWRIPWTEKPGRLWFVGSQRVSHEGATEHAHSYIVGSTKGHLEKRWNCPKRREPNSVDHFVLEMVH